ncbi:hypothetical protein B0H13DRAFT_2306201 [Mycena leptocephala]|nr:hypothetical protein B0H13DRAFT_2306201 [Mycena leptocephala]
MACDPRRSEKSPLRAAYTQRIDSPFSMELAAIALRILVWCRNTSAAIFQARAQGPPNLSCPCGLIHWYWALRWASMHSLPAPPLLSVNPVFPLSPRSRSRTTSSFLPLALPFPPYFPTSHDVPSLATSCLAILRISAFMKLIPKQLETPAHGDCSHTAPRAELFLALASVPVRTPLKRRSIYSLRVGGVAYPLATCASSFLTPRVAHKELHLLFFLLRSYYTVPPPF